jgi:DUF1680 family protein
MVKNNFNSTKILPGFWGDRLAVNAEKAIFHQWEQLEASGCIENFRLAAGEKEGSREGWFFADSDAYKWLDAASRICASSVERSTFDAQRLNTLMDAFIALLSRAQSSEGYLFTYNQLHFPGTRWVNLQIEHELYCHGHLIEAGVSHFEATGRTDMLAIARRAAQRIVADFSNKGPADTPGHEEIEIALLRLYQVTDHAPYLEMARQFIERRGRTPFFGLSLLSQIPSSAGRSKFVKQAKQAYLSVHPEFKPFQLPPSNLAKRPRNSTLRWFLNGLSGKFQQQHAPVRRQKVPVGHAVRFGYLETATAMLLRLQGVRFLQKSASSIGDRSRETSDAALLHALELAWEHMVTRRMYVTGGIGSLPDLEGFGNDYELDPEYAYAETCAALASLFWNWEMARLTGEAKYGDLFEWQLYNAAAVGMGLDGASYLYNNPLTCHGGVTRRPWYCVPCCPSNLSRTWADLGRYIISPDCHCEGEARSNLFIHQYISSETDCDLARLTIQSGLPWDGKVEITLHPASSAEFTLHLRIPSWCQTPVISVNNDHQTFDAAQGRPSTFNFPTFPPTAIGYDPRLATWLPILRTWANGDVIRLEFNMTTRLLRTHPKVRGQHGKVAVTRGPLVYCLESVDNRDVDIFSVTVDSTSLTPKFDAGVLGGVVKIEGQTTDGKPLAFIPYHLWGNRGESQMNVFVNA